MSTNPKSKVDPIMATMPDTEFAGSPPSVKQSTIRDLKQNETVFIKSGDLVFKMRRLDLKFRSHFFRSLLECGAADTPSNTLKLESCNPRGVKHMMYYIANGDYLTESFIHQERHMKIKAKSVDDKVNAVTHAFLHVCDDDPFNWHVIDSNTPPLLSRPPTFSPKWRFLPNRKGANPISNTLAARAAIPSGLDMLAIENAERMTISGDTIEKIVDNPLDLYKEGQLQAECAVGCENCNASGLIGLSGYTKLDQETNPVTVMPELLKMEGKGPPSAADVVKYYFGGDSRERDQKERDDHEGRRLRRLEDIKERGLPYWDGKFFDFTDSDQTQLDPLAERLNSDQFAAGLTLVDHADIFHLADSFNVCGLKAFAVRKFTLRLFIWEPYWNVSRECKCLLTEETDLSETNGQNKAEEESNPKTEITADDESNQDSRGQTPDGNFGYSGADPNPKLEPQVVADGGANDGDGGENNDNMNSSDDGVGSESVRLTDNCNGDDQGADEDHHSQNLSGVAKRGANTDGQPTRQRYRKDRTTGTVDRRQPLPPTYPLMSRWSPDTSSTEDSTRASHPT